GLSLDMAGFESAMQAQRDKARSASKFESAETLDLDLDGETAFLGYEALSSEGKVLALFKDGKRVEVLNAGDDGVVVLDHTAFYAESGGQVGDVGQLLGENFAFDVRDTGKQGGLFLHRGSL